VEALFDAQVVVGSVHHAVPGDRHRQLQTQKKLPTPEGGKALLRPTATGHIIAAAVGILGAARGSVNPEPAAFVSYGIPRERKLTAPDEVYALGKDHRCPGTSSPHRAPRVRSARAR